MIRRTHLSLSLGLLSLLSACGSAADSSTHVPTVAPKLLRFSGIPDADKAKLNANAAVIQAYLSRELGIAVQFVESASYNAACNGVASNKLDLAWLGGVTTVQAEQRSDHKVTLVTCRENDLHFKSYFIAHKDAVSSGKIQPAESLEALRDSLKDCTFTFGSKSSTSGRVMPQHFMARAGISIDDGVKGGAKFQLQGGHSATLKAVASGSVEVGALNYKTYDRADAATRASAPIIYTTPTYVDYCMVAHNRLGKTLIDKIRTAFTKLDPANAEHAKVLDAFSARRFVAARAADWDGIRAVLGQIKLD